jgi:hypothetical protein
MDKPRKFIMPAIACLSVIGALALSTLRAGHGQSIKDVNAVRVVNTPAQAVPIVNVNDGRQPFQTEVSITVPDTFGGENGAFTVPTGFRLVIEQISAIGFLPSGQKAVFEVFTQINGATSGTPHHLVANSRGSFGGQDLFEACQQTRLYADPGTQVLARIDRDLSTGTGTARFSISGYLVKL